MKCWHVRLLHSTVSVICIWYMYTKQRILTFKKWSPSMYPRKIESHIFVLDVPGKQCRKVGPRVVVSTATFHARVRGSGPGLGGLKETKNVSSPSTCESQYCGEPPWPRGNVLGLRPPGPEFRILCLEGSVISIISPSSGGSPGPV